MVVLDTKIIIDHLRLTEGESVLMKLTTMVPRNDMAISVITVQELYVGQSTRDGKKVADLLATIAPLRVFAYTYEIAQLAGEIARDLTRPIELADAAIAATTILNDAELVTLNTKDFKNIPGLMLFSPN